MLKEKLSSGWVEPVVRPPLLRDDDSAQLVSSRSFRRA
jgi:hypothetical protein